MTPLRRRMIEDMRIRNLSPHTQRAYVEQVSRFARHFGQPPERLGQDEIRAWQIYLVEERRLAASSISIAVAALRFVYTVSLKRPWVVEEGIPTSRQPKKLPVVPSPEEVSRFLDAVKSPKHRMILTVCYATGLRISEAVSLKPAAIDSQRMVIRVEAGIRRVTRRMDTDLVPEIVDQFEHGQCLFRRPEAGDLDDERTQMGGSFLRTAHASPSRR
jgi:integrase/recombinase XerD